MQDLVEVMRDLMYISFYAAGSLMAMILLLSVGLAGAVLL